MRPERRVLALAAVAAMALLAALPLRLTAQAPAGATFKCKDGTYSTAATSRGACSRHGGVAEALGAAPAAPTAAAPVAPTARAAAPAAGAPPAGATFKCTDGTYSTAATPRGACSRHGGIAQTLGAAPAAAPAAAPPVAAPSAPAPTARAAAPTAAAPTGAAPANATALCKDGTYSMSQHRSGTCSRHGGVAQWLHQPPN